MGLCLEAAGLPAVLEQRAGMEVKGAAEQRKIHWNFTIGCLRLSNLTSRLTVCLRFSLGHE